MPDVGGGARDRFCVWIRRRLDTAAPYALRFEVTDGKGILRVARPGVLVDPPARPSGFEERLTPAQVRASRFLHVWDGGRQRQSHLLVRLEEGALSDLPADRWVALESKADASSSFLLLPAEIAADPGRTDDEPTWPRRQVLADLQRELIGPSRSEPSTSAEEDSGAWQTQIVPVPPAPRSSAADTTILTPLEPRARGQEGPSAPVAVRRGAPPSSTPPAGPPATGFAMLDAWLAASDAQAGGDEDRTVLMSGSALAADRRDTVGARPALPALPPIAPPPYDPAVEEEIEAGEAEEGGEDTGALEAGEAPPEELEAIEDSAIDPYMGPPVEIWDDEEESVDDPPSIQSGVYSTAEAVTVMPMLDVVDPIERFREESERLPPPAVPGAGTPAPPAAVDVSPNSAVPRARPVRPLSPARPPDQGDADEPTGYAPVVRRAESSPGDALHERTTTLVRFLRRRIASDRLRIESLEGRVRALEAELARRDGS